MEATVRHGAPTEPAVNNLMEFFGVPDEGTIISWEDLEAVLSLSRSTSRFRTVVGAWRSKLFREHNVFMSAVGSGGGLVSSPPNTRVDVAARKIEQGRRAVLSGMFLAATTDHARLDADRQRTVASIAALNGVVLQLHTSAWKNAKPLPEVATQRRQDRGYVVPMRSGATAVPGEK